jgi:hypothetical protein
MRPLCKTLDNIWSIQSGKELNFIIASTIRNETTYVEFLNELNKFNFKHELIDKEHSSNIKMRSNSTPDCFIEILRIQKK